jgi:ATP-dependent RNA helicase RhlE
MERSPFPVKALHGGYDQASRFRVMSAFRTGEVKALLATDVASRGLDVDHVTYVINYSVPKDVQVYTHRIGRTGRAGRSGQAITLVTPDKWRRWSDILRRAPWDIPEVDEPGRPGSRRARREERPERGSRGEPKRRGGRGSRAGDSSGSGGREGAGRGRGRSRGGRGRQGGRSEAPRDTGFGSGI